MTWTAILKIGSGKVFGRKFFASHSRQAAWESAVSQFENIDGDEKLYLVCIIPGENDAYVPDGLMPKG